MRNLLSFFALVISLAGMGISLTREEIRCWVGLPSNACHSSRLALPSVVESKSPSTLRQETGGVEETRESSASAAPATAAPKETKANSKPTEAAAAETKPSQSADKQNLEVAPAVAQESAPTASPPQEASQPIEVIPPAAETSQPIEVIPPPASSNP